MQRVHDPHHTCPEQFLSLHPDTADITLRVKLTPLEKDLEIALLAMYAKWVTIGYQPHHLKRMLTSSNPQFYRGPVGTVHYVTLAKAVPTGFQRLVDAGKLTWTVEWLIAMNPQWHPLFTRWPWVITTAEARIRHVQRRE